MILLNATDISKSYTASPLLSNLSYAINEGDKIGLIGVNGTGKSTLLRITAGVEDADSGKIILTGGVRIGYLPQAPAYDPEKTMLEQAVSYLTRETAAEGEYKCKSMLNQLGITDFEKKMSTLSGGERKRVAMAGIFTNECDILILDEPTNDLDIDTLCILEDYLDSFAGAVIAVSHDRHFIDRIAEKTFVYEGEGHIAEYPGGYSDWAERRAAGLAAEKTAGKSGGKTAAASDGKQTDTSTPQTGRTDAARPKKLKLSYKEQREFETIDEDITTLESAIEEVDGRIAEARSDYCKLQELTAALDEKMERWVYLNDLAEKIEAQKRL